MPECNHDVSVINGETGPAVYLSSVAAYLPSARLSVKQAISQGCYSVERSEKEGYHSLAVSHLSSVDMGLKVAQSVLDADAGMVDEIAWLSYSSIHDNGVGGFWTPAAYLQRKTQTRNAIPLSISHGCNSLMIAAMTASKVIGQQQDALIVSADKFSGSHFDRWSSDLGVLYGDAAVAAILSKRRGFACIRYLDILSVPELEGMHRGKTLHCEVSQRWNIAGHKKVWMSINGKNIFFEKMQAAIDIAVSRLVNAGFAQLRNHATVVFPFVGKKIVESLYEPAFGLFASSTMKDYGYQIGHTGPSDQLLGLCGYLSCSQPLKIGETILLIGVGAGFSISVMVLEIKSPIKRQDDLLTVVFHGEN